jgi:protein arginine N-methyltransferase 3
MAEAYPRASDGESVSSSDNEEEWLDNPAAGEDSDDDELLEQASIVSLLDDKVFADAPSMLAHCRDKFGFDFVGVRDRLALDFHGCVRLINFGESLSLSLSLSLSFYCVR